MKEDKFFVFMVIMEKMHESMNECRKNKCQNIFHSIIVANIAIFIHLHVPDVI